jgi:hypothetical protein
MCNCRSIYAALNRRAEPWSTSVALAPLGERHNVPRVEASCARQFRLPLMQCSAALRPTADCIAIALLFFMSTLSEKQAWCQCLCDVPKSRNLLGYRQIGEAERSVEPPGASGTLPAGWHTANGLAPPQEIWCWSRNRAEEYRPRGGSPEKFAEPMETSYSSLGICVAIVLFFVLVAARMTDSPEFLRHVW